MPGHPGGGHAVELVDPEGHRLEQPDRVPHPHQVPGPVDREVGHRGGQGLEHGRPGFAHREPTDPVAVEAQRPRCARRSPPASSGSVPPCTMPNRAWPSGRASRPVVVAPGPGRPRRRPVDGHPQHLGRGREGGADVEHHLDVGPDQPLGLDGRLRGEPEPVTVVDRGEGHAVVVHAGPERVDLVAAGVGQGVPVPAGETVEATEAGHRRQPRAGASGGRCWPAPPRPRGPRGRRCPAP